MKSGRKDHKNRILREGESQDKEGRYRYTYYENGKQKCFYSWKLETNDKLPVGKKDCIALRVQIEEMKKRQLFEYSNAIVHDFQKFRAPFSGKIVHIFPEQSAVI